MFKHKWIGVGALALFASDDIDSCMGILGRVSNKHTEQMLNEPGQRDLYEYADAVADTGRSVLRSAYGESWRKDAPKSAFLVAGFRHAKDGSHWPQILSLHSESGFEPKPLEHPVSAWGHDEIAKYWINELNPEWPLSDEQLALLAVFLIQESSHVLTHVGNMAFLHVIRPGEEPQHITIDTYRRLSAVASRLGDNVRNQLRRDLGIREVAASDPLGVFGDVPRQAVDQTTDGEGP